MANWFGSALKAAGETARSLGKTMGETTASAASAAGKTAGGLSKSISQTTSNLTSAAGQTAAHVGATLSDTTAGLVNTVRGWRPFSNEDTLAFFAVLFAVAAADKQIDEDELKLILASPEAHKLSAEDKETLQSYSYQPPELAASVHALAQADPELKFGLIFCLLNLVRINDKMTSAEAEAIAVAQNAFKINDVQLDAIRDFIQLLATTQLEHSEQAMPDIKAATERMKSVGIPVKALLYAQNDDQNGLEYSDQRFLEKMRSFGLQAGRGLVEQAYVMWYTLHAPETPASAKLTIAGALAYWILPVDLLPDILPAVGFTDDFTTIATAMTSIAMSITPEIRAKAKVQTEALFEGEDGATSVPLSA